MHNKIKRFLKEERWVTFRRDSDTKGVWLRSWQYDRSEEFFIEDDFKITKIKSKFFIKDWKWKLYEFLYEKKRS